MALDQNRALSPVGMTILLQAPDSPLLRRQSESLDYLIQFLHTIALSHPKKSHGYPISAPGTGRPSGETIGINLTLVAGVASEDHS